MMKTLSLTILLIIGSNVLAQYNLIWEDNFNNDTLNSNSWTKIDARPWAWRSTQIIDTNVIKVSDGTLKLNAIKNPHFSGNLENVKTIDTATVWTGAVWTQNKVSFKYGKLLIKARIESAPRAWPAIWLLPSVSKYGPNPNSGEIDILEHLNKDSHFYTSVHTEYSATHGDPQKTKTASFNANVAEWVVYEMEWTPTKITFSKDGVLYHSFEKGNSAYVNGTLRWPFDEEFFLVISQQVGGGWVDGDAKSKGLSLNDSDLPITMEIDYVKLYQKDNQVNSLFSLEPSLEEIKAFPNPTNGIVFLSPSSENAKYTVYSSLGKQVKSGIYTTDGINLTTFPQGSYTIKIADSSVKVIVK